MDIESLTDKNQHILEDKVIVEEDQREIKKMETKMKKAQIALKIEE